MTVGVMLRWMALATLGGLLLLGCRAPGNSPVSMERSGVVLPPPPMEVLRKQRTIDLPTGIMRDGDGRIFSLKDGAELAHVPRGRARLFRPALDGGLEVRRDVEVGEFLVDRHPVTAAQFREFAQATGWVAPGKWKESPGHWWARGVTWRGVREYCRWAGRRPVSEAELLRIGSGSPDWGQSWSQDPGMDGGYPVARRYWDGSIHPAPFGVVDLGIGGERCWLSLPWLLDPESVNGKLWTMGAFATAVPESLENAYVMVFRCAVNLPPAGDR